MTVLGTIRKLTQKTYGTAFSEADAEKLIAGAANGAKRTLGIW
jgi:hypothetical protein